MQIRADTKEFLSERGYVVVGASSRKITVPFIESQISTFLWNSIKEHPSVRVVFSALIKSGIIDLNAVLAKLPDLLETSGTSFVSEAYCSHCNNILDKKHFLDYGSNNFRNNINCLKCNTRNVFVKESYEPNFNPKIDDLIRLLLNACQQGLFSVTYVLHCFTCQSFSSLAEGSMIQLNCAVCRGHKFLSSEFVPEHETLQELMKNKQGYWLEWYIWKMLAESHYLPEIGLKLTKGKVSFDCDVLIIQNGKVIVIECKDSGDSDFLSKLPHFGKLVDHYVLVTNTKMNPDIIKTMKKVLGKKGTHIPSEKMEELPTVISKLLK